jgi:hypothetical protein
VFNEEGNQISRIDGLYPEPVFSNIIEEFNEKAKHLGNINKNEEQKTVNTEVQTEDKKEGKETANTEEKKTEKNK